MKNNDTTYHRIERYLRGQMEVQEQVAFERELADDRSLAQQVELHRLAEDLVIERRLLEVQQILGEANNDQNRWKGWISSIIGLLIFGSLATLTFFYTKKVNDVQETNMFDSQETNLPLVGQKVDTLINAMLFVPEGQMQHVDVPDKKIASVSGTKPFVPKNDLKKSMEVAPQPDKDLQKPDDIKEPQVAQSDVSTVSAPVFADVVGVKVDSSSQKDTTVDPCAQVSIIAKVVVNNACAGEDNGNVSVTNITGGRPPYQVTLLDHNMDIVDDMGHIYAGKYFVEIKDDMNCAPELRSVEVVEKHCSKDYHFNPFIGESWEIPVLAENFVVKVYDRSGNVIFEKRIEAGEQAFWTGNLKNGEPVAGYYLFHMYLNNGRVMNGSVTIVR